ncbi:MAG TPA: hypothetical protein DCY86_19245 [Bdellovibrionales bacterium]|nr:hypothetical protein [Bdellovibrionales bacterium]
MEKNMKTKILLAVFFGSLFTLRISAEEYKPEFCFQCHEDNISRAVVHSPAKELCTFCHVAHQDFDNPTAVDHNLIAQPNELCLMCHDVSDVNHPAVGHPTDMDADPLYPSRPFNCISCHNPHSSSMNKLFRYNYQNNVYKGRLCTVCHWKNFSSSPVPPTPPWNAK